MLFSIINIFIFLWLTSIVSKNLKQTDLWRLIKKTGYNIFILDIIRRITKNYFILFFEEEKKKNQKKEK